MAARRNRRGRRRNRGRFGGLYKLLSILIIFAAILAGCIIFFRVNTMVVSGNARYTQEEVIAAAGVERGDNLFTLNKYQIADRILTQLPYVEDVSISRKLPDALIFEVAESAGVAWVESGGSYWLMNGRCKLLETGDAALVQGKPQLLGLTPESPTVGNTLTVPPEGQDKLERLQAFLEAIQARLMTGSLSAFIDLSSDNEIRFGYGQNLTVIFPLNGDFDNATYELKRTLETMDERGIPRTGTLDLNYESKEVHLLPERWVPEGWSPPEPPVQTPEPPAAEGGPGETEPVPEHTPTTPEQVPEPAE
nr:FtsQ-type POTRA domain-containing protein [uncultured Flavonifractor sp.]